MKQAKIPHSLMLLCCGVHVLAYAAPPSKSVRESCLLNQPISAKVHLDSLSTESIFEQDAYIDDYDAPYYFLANGTEIAYAEKAQEAALVYSKKIYRLASALAIPPSLTVPNQFSPALATWDRIKQGKTSYLCVGFNFDGLGHSGSMQNLRGAFLLPLGSRNPQLYYIEGDIRKIIPTSLRTK